MEPKRRSLLLAAAGLVLFIIGLLAGRRVERQAQTTEADAGGGLFPATRRARTAAPSGPAESGLSYVTGGLGAEPEAPAGSLLPPEPATAPEPAGMRGWGAGVAAGGPYEESGPLTGGPGATGAGKGGQAAGGPGDGQGPRRMQTVSRGNAVTGTLANVNGQTNASYGGAAGTPSAAGAPPNLPGGAGAHRVATKLAPIPATGPIKDATPQGGASGGKAQSARAAGGGGEPPPPIGTTDQTVYQIKTDKAASFQLNDGRGPHEGKANAMGADDASSSDSDPGGGASGRNAITPRD